MILSIAAGTPTTEKFSPFTRPGRPFVSVGNGLHRPTYEDRLHIPSSRGWQADCGYLIQRPKRHWRTDEAIVVSWPVSLSISASRLHARHRINRGGARAAYVNELGSAKTG